MILGVRAQGEVPAEIAGGAVLRERQLRKEGEGPTGGPECSARGGTSALWARGERASGVRAAGAGWWGQARSGGGDAVASERLSARRGLRRRRVGWAGALRATRAAVPRPDAGEGSGPAECGPRRAKGLGC